jgi:hypothetical protein
MGIAHHTQPVKLFAGLIYHNESVAVRAIARLQRSFGVIDMRSPVLIFSHTNYYQQEFGTDLKRLFVSFKKLIAPDALVRIKHRTNALEKRSMVAGKRAINIDPGYLHEAKLVLATTKDFAHRLYIGKGMYAETTLLYRNKAFIPLEWTYPDYRSSEYHQFFHNMRRIYVEQIKK